LPVLELWVRDSEHEGQVLGCGLESRSGYVVIDVVVDGGQCLAERGRGARGRSLVSGEADRDVARFDRWAPGYDRDRSNSGSSGWCMPRR
jgi:hypothetical protein